MKSVQVTYLIFKRYEPETPLPLVLFLGVVPGALSWLHLDLSQDAPHVVAHISSTYTAFYAIVLLCIVIYRISPFHPLASYPGPFLHKLSKFRMVWVLFQRRHRCLGVDVRYYQSLHQEYGVSILTGPNELSIVDADAIGPILGGKGFPKGPFWDGRVAPGVTRSLISERDPVEHQRRRRTWNRAFSQTSLQGYEDILRERTLQFVATLETLQGSLDLDQWISFYTFDFMGDMAFRGGFELIRHGEDHTGVVELMDTAFLRNNMTAHVPYTLRYLVMLPSGSHNTKFMDFASERVAIRRREGALRKDLFHHLIDEEGIEPMPPPMNELMSDGLLAIVAGSDTTSHVLVNLFQFIMTHPATYARLQAEIDSAFPPGALPYDTHKQADMPYLEAVINETMRLQPPLPNGAQRSTQRIGARMVGNHFIPAGTQVQINTYALQRDPRYFYPCPEDFFPDRWLEPIQWTPEFREHVTAGEKSGRPFVHDVRAFVPFSFGPAMCVGRPLAYMQMRMVVCAIMRRFHMRIAPGSDLKDYAIAGRGILPTILTPRSSR
ncbi:cytochrome P450 [Fistulina hepatica ATCC 64428]|uniref:Cytochrome P450 n=1 Tax=Fistulina hepatica ATCC 64428 TaxID=1128425 RepID=A0A0D7A4E4_9AGAR|nr:cytochrome P450 [Fistulina hepatica ATCC 64428]